MRYQYGKRIKLSRDWKMIILIYLVIALALTACHFALMAYVNTGPKQCKVQHD